MSKIVLINGPPQSGKDTLGDLLCQHLDVFGYRGDLDKMAGPIRDMLYTVFGWDGDFIEKNKSVSQEILGHKTVRDAMISFSEDYLKQYGQDIFGKLLCSRLERTSSYPDFHIITDCGFNCEVAPVYEKWGREHCYVIQIRRPGCTFENDSREYVEGPDTTITNEGDLNSFVVMSRNVSKTLMRWVNTGEK